jgi:hypothetical protein
MRDLKERKYAPVYCLMGDESYYIDQICDYTEDSEHDDAPDSAACCARIMISKRRNEGYVSKLY